MKLAAQPPGDLSRRGVEPFSVKNRCTIKTMPHWLMVILVWLTVYRLTRLITADAFPLFERPRTWLQAHWDPFSDADWQAYRKLNREGQQRICDALGIKHVTETKRAVAYLFSCAWCVSVWMAAGVVGVVMVFSDLSWLWSVLLWFSASAMTGLIAQREVN